MATIIYLRDRDPLVKRVSRPSAAEGPKGQILLFTGVRYERITIEARPGPAGSIIAGKR